MYLVLHMIQPIGWQGKKENYVKLSEDSILVPLFNRSLMAMYPPGSTFNLLMPCRTTEGVLFPDTRYSCPGGFLSERKMVSCHNHWSPLDLRQSIHIP